MVSRLRPTGICWYGCNSETEPTSFFIPGHDSKAESATLDLEYGGRLELLHGHGYGPSGRNLLQTLRRKYKPLVDYLAAQSADRVTLDFLQIEEILGAPLPRSDLDVLRGFGTR